MARKLSNQKLKYIRRNADSSTPEEIASAINVPVADVRRALNELGGNQETKPASGFQWDSLESIAAFVFAGLMALAPLIMRRDLAEASKTPKAAYVQAVAIIFLLVVIGIKANKRFSLGRNPIALILGTTIVG